MSLPTVLKVAALVVVGLLLTPVFVAMGPIGWVAIGSMFLVGVVQVHRKRSAVSGGARAEYCPNCGIELDDDAVATDVSEVEWEVAYCPDCGATVRGKDSYSRSRVHKMNCRDCGAPNDRGAEECDYCEAAL